MEKVKNYPQEPKHLWDAFYEITRIPRPSKKEGAIREYLKNEAKKHNLKFVEDSVGNVIIYVPGKGGAKNRPPVMIQGHMDMVCDKTPDREIDFEKDPIDLVVKDGKVYGDRTTLGADNGIAMAAAMAILREENVSHPPLELLFTVDEETGLHGAKNLEKNLFKSKQGLNLDTEDWGEIYIGCAGGVDYELTGEYEQTSPNGTLKAHKLILSGLAGGHSGCDIFRSRGNALKILTEVIWKAKSLGIELASLGGGKAHNIIPRDAEALLMLDSSALCELKKLTDEKVLELKKYLPEEDHKVKFDIVPEKNSSKVLSKKSMEELLSMLTLFPHGAYSYNWNSSTPLPNMSSNMAQVRINEGKVYVQTSVRFTEPMETASINARLEAVAQTYNLKMKKGVGYPSWKPEFLNNSLLDLACSTYKEMYGKTPAVKAVHAGLECGIIKDKLGEMQMVSFGPDIKNAHSPTEFVDIETTKKFWDYFLKLLSKM